MCVLSLALFFENSNTLYVYCSGNTAFALTYLCVHFSSFDLETETLLLLADPELLPGQEQRGHLGAERVGPHLEDGLAPLVALPGGSASRQSPLETPSPVKVSLCSPRGQPFCSECTPTRHS